MAKPTATAASMALPPFCSTSTPMRVPRFSWLATMPLRATTACAGGRSEERRRLGAGCAVLAAGASTSKRPMSRWSERVLAMTRYAPAVVGTPYAGSKRGGGLDGSLAIGETRDESRGYLHVWILPMSVEGLLGTEEEDAARRLIGHAND